MRKNGSYKSICFPNFWWFNQFPNVNCHCWDGSLVRWLNPEVPSSELSIRQSLPGNGWFLWNTTRQLHMTTMRRFVLFWLILVNLKSQMLSNSQTLFNHLIFSSTNWQWWKPPPFVGWFFFSDDLRIWMLSGLQKQRRWCKVMLIDFKKPCI